MAEESRVNGGVKTILGEESEIPRYYQVGRRPLDMPGGDAVYGDAGLEHWQFVSPDGGNFGYTTGNRIFSEDPTTHHYDFSTKIHGATKYNADFIDAAREQLEKEWKEKINAVDKMAPFSGFPEKVAPLPAYRVYGHHCKDFINEVVKRAEKIAKKKGAPLIIKDRARDSPAFNDDSPDPGSILYPGMVQNW